ncbi:hypothetical protein EH196_20225 [Bacillus sp. C1-1]|nr:hypothetical protein EH196_20225 [Bacillus sp. C1-1]
MNDKMPKKTLDIKILENFSVTHALVTVFKGVYQYQTTWAKEYENETLTSPTKEQVVEAFQTDPKSFY